MRRLRIAVVYIFGAGSSQVLKRRIERTLEKFDISADVFITDLNVGANNSYDIVFTSKELAGVFTAKEKPVVIISNFLSAQEIEQKGIPLILALAQKTTN